MSEERSWAEDTVELAVRERRAPSEPESGPRDPRRARPAGRIAAAAIGIAGASAIVLALVGGGGDSRARQEAVGSEPERSAAVNLERTIPSRPSLHRPVRRRAGSLVIGLGRPAPKPPKPKPAPAPAPAEPESPPSYEAVPEPVAAPAPAPEASPAPAPQTPAAVEFGM